jgi:hypothetical protein
VDAPEEPVPLVVVPPPTVRPGAVRLVPPEDRLESTWLACHEATLRRAYDIGPSVNIFFQEPGSLGIAGNSWGRSYLDRANAHGRGSTPVPKNRSRGVRVPRGSPRPDRSEWLEVRGGVIYLVVAGPRN